MKSNTKTTVAILSAHRGAAYWVKLIEKLNAEPELNVISLHGFEDERYRRGGTLWRCLLSLEIYVFYPLRVIFLLLTAQKNYDVFLVVTSPFFLPALCSLLSKKPVVTLQNDLYPEALILAGIVKRGGLVESVLRRISQIAVRRSSVLVYICESHRSLAESEFGTNPNTFIVPVGADAEAFAARIPSIEGPPVTLLYCGTLGRMHDASTILDYLCNKTAPEGCRFEFRTSGTGKAALENTLRKEVSLTTNHDIVSWGDALTHGEWAQKMSACSVGMVFQTLGAENVVFPSKVFSILMAGQAVFAIASQESELGRLIRENDCGWVVPPNDVDGVGATLLEIRNSELLLNKRMNAYRLGHSRYDISSLAGTWSEVILASRKAGQVQEELNKI